MSIELVDTDPLIFECRHCKNGVVGDDFCTRCGGDGIASVFERTALHTLAVNLATAAALCRAHELGYCNGWFTSKLGRDAGWTPGCGREQAVEP